ncbi:MAG: hypothetical protein R2695_11130 [Acidimicrobiales bacterium]
MADDRFDDFLELRKPGAHLTGDVKVNDEFAQSIGVDLVNFPRFAKSTDPGTTFAVDRMDQRHDLDRIADPDGGLDDYSGDYVPDLKLTDFSRGALATKLLPYVDDYTQLCVDAWYEEITRRFGAARAAEVEWSAWLDQIKPEVDRWIEEFLPAGTEFVDVNLDVAEADRPTTRVVYRGLFTPDAAAAADLSKPELVSWLLGSHEYQLQCIEAGASQLVVSDGLDEMFDIQYTLWGDTVLPGVKRLKEEYLGITGDQVEDWMKDLQIDATALPGKAFDLQFEMPTDDVGIMTFNRCVAVDQWESMGRPDILEKNCHSTCPKSMIVTTALYNPNMKVDILAIPPRQAEGDVCCKWKFSMRDEDDPKYVPVELSTKPT